MLKGTFFFGEWSDESESDFLHFGNTRGFSSLVCQSGSSCVPNLHIFDGPYKTSESLLFLYSADIVRRQMESYNKTNALRIIYRIVLIKYQIVDISGYQCEHASSQRVTCGSNQYLSYYNSQYIMSVQRAILLPVFISSIHQLKNPFCLLILRKIKSILGFNSKLKARNVAFIF